MTSIRLWALALVLLISISACRAPDLGEGQASSPQLIELNGSQSLQLPAGSAWTDPGVRVIAPPEWAVQVSVNGAPDLAVPGTYDISYSAASIAGDTQTLHRSVEIYESTPKLRLIVLGDGEVETQSASRTTICSENLCEIIADVGDTFTLRPTSATAGKFKIWQSCEQTAGDECVITIDGDDVAIAEFVQTAGVGDGSSGEQDTTPPVISLNGHPHVHIQRGNGYVDPGAVAFDLNDGTIAVETSGEADFENLGIYTITYSATDSAGNTSSVTRTIQVGPRFHTLTVSNIGPGIIDVNAASFQETCTESLCEIRLPEGMQVTLTATPLPNGSFDTYLNCDDVNGTICRTTIHADRAVFSTFEDTRPLELFDDVVTLSEEQILAIRDFDPALDYLSFDATADLSNIAAGKVLVSTGSSASEAANTIHFLRRVDAIYPAENGTIRVDTVNTPPGEVIKRGQLIARWELLPQSALSKSTARLEFPTFDESLEIDGKIKINARVSTGIKFETVLQFECCSPGNLDKARFVIAGGAPTQVSSQSGDRLIEASLGLDPYVSSYSHRKKIISRQFSPITVGPLVIIPSADLFLTGRITADSTYQPTLTIGSQTALGVAYTDGRKWHPVADYTPYFDVSLPRHNGVTVDLDAGPEFALATKISGLDGPYFSVRPYVGIRQLVRTAGTCKNARSAYFGIEANAVLRLKVFGISLTAKSFEIFDLEDSLSLNQPAACETSTEPPTNPEMQKFERQLKHDIQTYPTPYFGPDKEISETHILLDWKKSQDDIALDKYKVYRWLDDVNKWDVPERKLIRPKAGKTFIRDYDIPKTMGLSGGPHYRITYFVEAVDVDGNKSQPLIAIKKSKNIRRDDAKAPEKPVGLRIYTQTNGKTFIEWDPIADNRGSDKVTAQVYRVFNNDPNDIKLSSLVAQSDQTRAHINSEKGRCFLVIGADAEENLSEKSDIICNN